MLSDSSLTRGYYEVNTNVYTKFNYGNIKYKETVSGITLLNGQFKWCFGGELRKPAWHGISFCSGGGDKFKHLSMILQEKCRYSMGCLRFLKFVETLGTVCPLALNNLIIIKNRTLVGKKCSQLSLLRVATAQGKQGIWTFIFPDRENTGNLPKILKIWFYTGNLTPNTGTILKF